MGGNYVARERSESNAQEQENSSLTKYGVAVFSHELGNSLAVISCSLQFVERAFETKQTDDSRVGAAIRGALGEIARLESLLDEFRCPAGLQTVELVVADLLTVVEEVLALQTLACQSDGITFQREFAKAVPWVRLNPAKIKQVILNLCKNAIEAMPQGGSLTIKVYQSAANVILEISDNGIGLPPHIKTLDGLTTTKRGGRGIGLMVVQEIVAAHDAALTFSSEAGRGTTFKIDFPFTQ